MYAWRNGCGIEYYSECMQYVKQVHMYKYDVGMVLYQKGEEQGRENSIL